MNLIIPLSGLGSRFKEKGYALPKPLIDVEGKPMIQRVYESLGKHNFSREIFVCSQEHEIDYQISKVIKSFCPNAIVIFLDEKTEGAACTVLKGIPFCEKHKPLVVVNSDQLVDIPRFGFVLGSNFLVTFPCPEKDPKWSYVEAENGVVTRVVEKQAVSDIANTGAYVFATAGLFELSAYSMILKDIRINGEYYVAPVYNEIIEAGFPVFHTEAKHFVGLGTPEDLEKYLNR